MSATAVPLRAAFNVFISHSRDDQPLVERIERGLTFGGRVRVLTDRSMLSAGQPWRAELRRALETTDVFVVIGSPASARSDFVLQELGGAWALGKPIVVVTPEGEVEWAPPDRAVGVREGGAHRAGEAGVCGRVAGRADARCGSEGRALAMRCPFCGSDDNQVKDSRPVEEGGAVRRRRQCNACGARFTTFERIQLRELTVIKRDGRRVPFDRDKLKRSIMIATRKRGIEEERIERLVNGIVREIEITGETEIEAKRLGALAMQRLAELDQVAYVRFASVYRDFTGVKDFEQLHRAHGQRAPGRGDRRPRPDADIAAKDDRDDDRHFMALALRLAERGLGSLWPNPAVGCVLVKDGRIVGRGWTQPGGRPHAEVEALRRAGAAALGATAYVTLEPCAHYGRTPPCTMALIHAGMRRVVVATVDPDPRVDGRGIAQLRQAGVEVEVGLLARRGRGAQRRLLLRVRARPAAGDAQARDLARWPDRDPERRQPVDHRRAGARPRPLAARDPRRDHDRQRHRARRRSRR